MTVDGEIDRLSDAYLSELVKLRPTFATTVGIAGHDGQYPDYSPAGYEAQLTLTRRTATRARVTPTDDQREYVAKATLLERLEVEADLLEAGIPQHQLGAVISPAREIRQVYDLMDWRSDEEVENIAARLGGVAQALASYRTTLSDQAALGRVAPIRQIEGLAQRIARWTGTDAHDFFTDLVGQEADPGRRAMIEPLAADARRAYDEFGTWLTTELAPRAPDHDACGRDAYELGARLFLGTNINLEETYLWGWHELHRIETEMQRTAARLNNGDTNIRSATQLLDNDPDHTVHGQSAFIEWMNYAAHETTAKLSAGGYFDIPPSIQRLRVRLAPTSDGAMYYTRPSEDLTRPGEVWWSPPAGQARFATWSMITDLYHEGVPGHHLQRAYALLRSDLLNRWQRLACWVSGHGEGWAMYAERLMDELGYLRDPANKLGMLDAQALRAARVVVDIGMHLQLKVPNDNPLRFAPAKPGPPNLATNSCTHTAACAPTTSAPRSIVISAGLAKPSPTRSANASGFRPATRADNAKAATSTFKPSTATLSASVRSASNRYVRLSTA